MILYGRDMSPYVRRIACWCALQGREVERRKLTVAGEDFETLRGLNPVVRVPILILDDGTRMIETFAICDWLDETAPDRRLLPESGLARRNCLQRLAIANSTAEKAVALVYDRNRRPAEYHWEEWQSRLKDQIAGGLAELNALAPEEGFHGGDRPDGSDIAMAITFDFVEVQHPDILEGRFPRLAAFAARANALPEIGATKPLPG